jgi:hypothetical protein
VLIEAGKHSGPRILTEECNHRTLKRSSARLVFSE